MAGFYSILSKGINALDRNTPEARRRLYECATAALIAEMRGFDPALNQSEFQVAWRSLKEAIVKIEIEAAAEIETEAEPKAEPKADAEAQAQRDRLIHRPIATTSTSLRRAGIAAASARPAVRLGGQRRPRLMGFLTRAFRRDPDAAARNERRRLADRGEYPSSDFWSEMESGQPHDNWLSDVLARASRDDLATLKKRG
ncbi:MAG TPA: hypothetical protein VG145_06605 [Xanthobacteraceae bacterium]|jgi:hypothetical protein|nr:hypothetical protein [Xanthobacteraceae bacterium]